MELIAAIQDSALGVWLRESSWGLFACLIAHTAAMGLIVGLAGVTFCRVLGGFRSIPPEAMGQALSILPPAVGTVIVSGVLLVIAYPAKALTNPWFWIKLALVLAAGGLTLALNRELKTGAPTGRWPRMAAAAGLLLWPAALVAGKFIEYTYDTLLV